MKTISNVFTELQGFDASLEQQLIPSSTIIPRGGELIQIDSRDYTWSALAAKQIRHRCGILGRLEKNLPSEVVQTLWQARVQHETKQPQESRCLPGQLKVSILDGRVVGFVDAGLVTLSNAQVVEAIEEATSQLPLHKAEVTLSGDIQAAAWQLKVIFPFQSVEIESQPGDIIRGGLIIKHSAAGLHGTQVRNFLHRLVCSNGSTVPICADNKQLRIRRRREDQFADQDVIEKLRLVVGQGVRELDAKLKAVAGLAEKKANAVEVLKQIALKYRVRKTVRDRLLSALQEDEFGPVDESTTTMFDVWNAVTRVTSHDTKNLLRDGIRDRLNLFTGVYSQQSIHTCPTCNRILEPSRN